LDVIKENVQWESIPIGRRSARRGRRRQSAEFKAEAIKACRQPGMSIAAAAMARSINANLLRRWITEAGGDEIMQATQKAAPPPIDAFIALPAPTRSQTNSPIQIEVRCDQGSVGLQFCTSVVCWRCSC
jgi:transposase-like protein